MDFNFDLKLCHNRGTLIQRSSKGNIMKVKVTGHVVYVKYPWDTEGRYVLMATPVSNFDSSYADVGVSVEVEVDIPKEFNPNAIQLSVLQKQKLDLIKKFDESVARINEQISKLQAIEYTA